MNAKRAAAAKAVEAIEDGMVIGLGTGSTAGYAIEAIGERVKKGMNVTAIPTSHRSEELARALGIPLHDLSVVTDIHLTIDGADEVDPGLNLIKGGGGSLLREKIIAANSRRFFVIVDHTKLVDTLGRFPLPVEIVPFGSELTLRGLREIQGAPTLRMVGGDVYVTDNGNYIADCHLSGNSHLFSIEQQMRAIPGVVETGFFPRSMVSAVFVGHDDGTVNILRP